MKKFYSEILVGLKSVEKEEIENISFLKAGKNMVLKFRAPRTSAKNKHSQPANSVKSRHSSIHFAAEIRSKTAKYGKGYPQRIVSN